VFDPGPVPVRFVVDKVALGQVFLRVLRFSPVNITPTMYRNQLHLTNTPIRRTSGLRLGTLTVSDIEEALDRQIPSRCF
jgi:hypothetical protein